MKPPPRKRAKVDRNLVLEPVSRSSLSKWQQPEKRKLLKALHKLSKTSGGNVDIDYSFLQTCNPKPQLPLMWPSTQIQPECLSYQADVCFHLGPQIQGVVESLKEKVISGTLCELNKWKAERKLRKPIEIWTELAFSVTGSHEEHISTAFSQMLMVSSTEPCTLTYCDPPQVHRPLTVTLLGCTVPPKPRPRASLQARAVTSRASPGNQQSAVPSPAAENSPRPPSENSAVTTHSADASSVQQPASPQPPSTNPDVATSGMPISVATHDDPSLSQSAAAVGSNATKDTPRTPGIKCVADFEKIYRYLSEVHKPDKVCNLTPMESAIVLDLLMSLPEELLLLDCNKLHKHLIQVYKCLSSPADSKEAKEMLEKLKSTFAGQAEETPSSRAGKDAVDQQSAEAAADGGLQSQQNGSALNQNTPEPSTSTDLTGFSPPPLNPFMIPLEMLMRE